ncbi:hypothetical protein DFJ58DRAFT_915051 [Suillus subalutaceus]|uniref:uncharacterized protein n=1 Tax=Suillus subalutaceus TaxID=48586 RepID=UPI001B878033|nr:uncharacterized protein DFJ58DRAFT_915051 [Suillus subalutaceus]KAG1848316.1 hypothetical protein DFJ58DRAFT_915051 [Suillus subalutaceus]
MTGHATLFGTSAALVMTSEEGPGSCDPLHIYWLGYFTSVFALSHLFSIPSNSHLLVMQLIVGRRAIATHLRRAMDLPYLVFDHPRRVDSGKRAAVRFTNHDTHVVTTIMMIMPLANERKAYSTVLPHLSFCRGNMITMVGSLATAFTSPQVVVADSP